jgi:HSP20 family protein
MLRKNQNKSEETKEESVPEFNQEQDNQELTPPQFLSSEPEGELAIDVYQTPTQIVIQSPVAGVKEEDLDVSVEGDMITIRGKREREELVNEKDYFYQECYWGTFSRTVSLPTTDIDIDKSGAAIKNGILTVTIPRIEKRRSKKLKIGKE